MDATLYSHNIQIDRTQLIPTSADTISATWCRKVAEQQIRAAGIAGSAVMDFTVVTGPPNIYVSTFVRLPTGWFLGTRPPMVYAFPQYGSALIYKQFVDVDSGYAWPNEFSRSPYFRTWIQNMKIDPETNGWKFEIHHKVWNTWRGTQFNAMAPPVYYPTSPIHWMWLPPIVDNDYCQPNDTRIITGKMLLHWVCLGVDPSF
jgi:hypothetical protein